MNESIAKEKTLTIYSQNISGGKSKIYRLNDFLINTTFDIIALQETWYDNTVNSAEIIAASNFQICRMDRSKFQSNRSKGGGICLFIRDGIEYMEIVNPQQTTIEMQALRITNAYRPIIVLNVYLPPYRSRVYMVDELANFVRYLKRIKLDTVVIIISYTLASYLGKRVRIQQ